MQLFSANLHAMQRARREELHRILPSRKGAAIFGGNVALTQIKTTLIRIEQY